MPGATIVVLATFREGYQVVFQEYSRRVREFLASKGATVIRRQVVEQVIYGDLSPSLVMVIDFPTREIAQAAFFEQAYLDVLPLREQVFSSFNMFLASPGEI
jgi:uncharacterized protein (DUF1330 family)